MPIFILLLLVLGGCEAPTSSTQQIWNEYDCREATHQPSPVPVDPHRKYYDRANEELKEQADDGFGACSPNDLMNFNADH